MRQVAAATPCCMDGWVAVQALGTRMQDLRRYMMTVCQADVTLTTLTGILACRSRWMTTLQHENVALQGNAEHTDADWQSYSICSARHAQLSTTEHCFEGKPCLGLPLSVPVLARSKQCAMGSWRPCREKFACRC